MGDGDRAGQAQIAVLTGEGVENVVAGEPTHVVHFIGVDRDVVGQRGGVATDHQ